MIIVQSWKLFPIPVVIIFSQCVLHWIFLWVLKRFQFHQRIIHKVIIRYHGFQIQSEDLLCFQCKGFPCLCPVLTAQFRVFFHTVHIKFFLHTKCLPVLFLYLSTETCSRIMILQNHIRLHQNTRIPLSSYTLPSLPSFLIARSSAITVATAPSIFSVDFSLSILIFPAGS